MQIAKFAHQLRDTGLGVARRLAFLGPLIARFTIGVAFIDSGWGKVHNLEKVTAYFTELGIPAPHIQATFVSCVELVCGSLVLLGLGTRLAAVPLICTMIVALITAKASDISGLSDLVGTIEFTYVALLVGLTLTGAGALSVDRWLEHLLARRGATTPGATPGAAPGTAAHGASVPSSSA